MLSDQRIIELDPSQDGITHINFYTRGKTRLGRLGTNLADIPVEHPLHGRFRTAEGYWYYLKTGLKFDELRSLDGFSAKVAGRKFPNVWHNDFREDFITALRWKVDNHAELKQLLTESTLPLEHYYYYSGKGPVAIDQSLSRVEQLRKSFKIIEPSDVRWLTEFFTELRAELQA